MVNLFKADNEEPIVVVHRLAMLSATDGFYNGMISGHSDIKKGQIRNHKGYLSLHNTNAIDVPAVGQRTEKHKQT